MIDYPNKLNPLFDKLQKNGAKPIIIGGFIRDSLLGIASKDIDIEVYNIASFKKLEEILKEFGSVNSVGKSFGVCKLTFDDIELDFTLPRIDNKIASGHLGFDVKVQPDLDFNSATSRRDFTINAIGYDVLNNKILDPFNGIKDLKNKILRAVNKKTFVEDPLRVLRAVQFCARFDLKLDEELFLLCKNMVEKNMLDELSKERVFQEIKKLLLKSSKPSVGFKILKEIGALKYFPELETLNEDSWNTTLLALDAMSKFKTDNNKTNTILMLAAVCHTFNSESVTKFITSLESEKELLTKVLALTNNLAYIDKIHYENLKDYLLFQLATKVKIEELLLLSKAVYFANHQTKAYQFTQEIYKRAKELHILNKKMPPLLRGRDILACGKSEGLKIEPSQEFSILLNKAYEAQMSGKFTSYLEATNWLKKHIKELTKESL